MTRPPETYFNLWLICAGCPHSSRSGRAAPVDEPPPLPQAGAAFYQAVRPLLRCPFAIVSPAGAIRKGDVMPNRENDANNIFRPSDRPLTEYEEQQKALRKNLERLRAERLAREAAKSKEA